MANTKEKSTNAENWETSCSVPLTTCMDFIQKTELSQKFRGLC